MPNCPLCQHPDPQPVIVYGLPARLCLNMQCNGITGIGAWLLQWLPYTGYFLAYDPGKYWSALWRWLTRRD